MVAAELGGTQISALLETLPGIANVLRSPVADALLNVIRAAARLREFAEADAEELIRYATRRGLVGNDEGDKVLAEVHQAALRRIEKAADRVKAKKAKEKAVKVKKPKPVKKTATVRKGGKRR